MPHRNNYVYEHRHSGYILKCREGWVHLFDDLSLLIEMGGSASTRYLLPTALGRFRPQIPATTSGEWNAEETEPYIAYISGGFLLARDHGFQWFSYHFGAGS